MDREYLQEVINGMRKIVKPYLAKQLKKINFEGCGNTDKAEFETDFEIVLTLAEQALAIPSAEPYKEEPSGDVISRQAVLEQTYNWSKDEFLRVANPFHYLRKRINSLPPVTPQPKIVHCKDCKYFEYDSVAKVDGIPLIVAHEICNKWGDGCKTSEDGWCFLAEQKESENERMVES